MSNSIRTPRQGVTASSRRIAQAVDDEGWQRFRIQLKGSPTDSKLRMLSDYWHWASDMVFKTTGSLAELEDIDIRVDNYIKALCRGGQLYPGESLQTALDNDWNLRIKR